jgi:hypothetical protein
MKVPSWKFVFFTLYMWLGVASGIAGELAEDSIQAGFCFLVALGCFWAAKDLLDS